MTYNSMALFQVQIKLLIQAQDDVAKLKLHQAAYFQLKLETQAQALNQARAIFLMHFLPY